MANRRDYRSLPDMPADFGYRGTTWRGEYKGIVTLDPAARLVLGYVHDAPDYRFFGFGSDEQHSASTDSVYGLAIVQPLARLTLTGGVRHDDHSQFGGVTTFGANGNWGLADGKTRVRFAYGEGFRAPSLYQLYDSFSGNRDLKPERSHSVDIGLDRSFADGHGRASLTLFTRETRNQIDYDLMASLYGNLDRTVARGAEVSVDLEPVKDFTLGLAYSLVDTRDRSVSSPDEGQHLSRRPVNSLSISMDRRWVFGLSTGATMRMVSDARDTAAPDGELDGYVLLGLRASLPISRAIELYARIDNVTDTRYETAYGFSTYGRSAYGGVRVRL
jgi:vitamin B12 transporter